MQKFIYCNRKWTQFNTPSRWYNAKIYTSTIVAIWARLLISIMEKFGFEGAVCSAATNTVRKKKKKGSGDRFSYEYLKPPQVKKKSGAP